MGEAECAVLKLETEARELTLVERLCDLCTVMLACDFWRRLAVGCWLAGRLATVGWDVGPGETLRLSGCGGLALTAQIGTRNYRAPGVGVRRGSRGRGWKKG